MSYWKSTAIRTKRGLRAVAIGQKDYLFMAAGSGVTHSRIAVYSDAAEFTRLLNVRKKC